MTSVDGSVPPSWGARRDPARRAFWIAYVIASMVVIAVAVLAMSAADREREDDVEVTATVLDGRGTSGEDAELLLRIPTSSATTGATGPAGGSGDEVERWVATDAFGDETVGSELEVHLRGGDVDRAHLARDCSCGPFTPADALPFLLLLAMPGAGAAVMGEPRRRAARTLASAVERQPVRVWWVGPSTGTLVVFDRHEQPLGSIIVPPSARVVLSDGSPATLVGRPEPGAAVALETVVGPILPMSALHPLVAQPTARSPISLLRGPTPEPIPEAGAGDRGRSWRSRRRALRGPAPATIATGVAAGLLPLLLLGAVAPLAPLPWSAVAIGLVAAAVMVQVTTALAARRRSRAATEAARAAAASAPPMPPIEPAIAPSPGTSTGIAGAVPLGSDRPLETPGRFLGFALTVVPVSFVWFFLLIIYWPLTALALVDTIRLLIRSPRPSHGRIVRPALPLLTATAVGLAGGWAWLAGISTDEWQLPMALRVPLVVASIPLAPLAWRMATVGVTVGDRRWSVRNVVQRTWFDAADIVAVRVGSDDPTRRAALEIDLVDGRTVLASRFAVSRRGARRLVEVLDAGRWPNAGPPGRGGGGPIGAPDGPSDGGAPQAEHVGAGSPPITPAHGPFWRG